MFQNECPAALPKDFLAAPMGDGFYSKAISVKHSLDKGCVRRHADRLAAKRK
jgi:hypothetical protein